MENLVAIQKLNSGRYPAAPFGPAEQYPELAARFSSIIIDPDNEVYGAVRALCRSQHFDPEHEGTADWNPLKDFIKPGQTVLLKPNLVFHKHPLGQAGIEGMITHAAVLRPLVDYAWIALEGRGRIIIADVPLQSADWGIIMKVSGLADLQDYYRQIGVPVEFHDLRLERSYANKYGIVMKRSRHNGDPRGYQAVDVGEESSLTPIIHEYKRLMITDYPQSQVASHHSRTKNEYLIARSVLEADVFINVPKLKTHRKSGVTLSMKNLIGINGDKSWIAHHRAGIVREGGDEAPSQRWWDAFRFNVYVGLKNNPIGRWALLGLLWGLHLVEKIGRPNVLKGNSKRAGLFSLASITEGSWYGNDTLWRVILDLNRILIYSNRDGKLMPVRQRNVLEVIDGVVGGERNGPMHHLPKRSAVIIAGRNPLMTDTVAAEYMGFDYRKIPQLREGYAAMPHSLVPPGTGASKIMVSEGNNPAIAFREWQKQTTLSFLPPLSWHGFMENSRRDKADQTVTDDVALHEGGGE